MTFRSWFPMVTHMGQTRSATMKGNQLFAQPGISILFLFLVCALSFLSSCTSKNAAHGIVERAQFREYIFSGEHFDIQGYVKGTDSVLHVYIEGDGKAWLNRRRPSSDPSPEDPIGLRLAATDTHNAVLYMARPCQFVEGALRRNCIVPMWTSARFSEPVVDDMNVFLDAAKKKTGAQRLKLVGYSGGGAIALLLAVQRSDVAMVVTIAGNVDHAFWTSLHQVSPLRESLNPADNAQSLENVRQVHVVSSDDSVIPPSVVQSYVGKMTTSDNVRIVTVDGVNHTDDWSVIVPDILNRYGAR